MTNTRERPLRGRIGSVRTPAWRLEGLEPRQLLAFSPTGAEQEMLELLNRMRARPAAELPLLLNSSDADAKNGLRVFAVNTTVLARDWAELAPAAPLAWNSSLYSSAKQHSVVMLNADKQDHQLPGEATMVSRIVSAGYANYQSLGENVFAYGKSVFHGHAAFAIDWGSTPTGIQDPAGHRENMMDPSYREVGIGIISSTSGKETGPLLMTQDFGSRSDRGDPYLLGVAYHDRNHDGVYTAGEGLAGVNVTVTGSAGSFSTHSLSAGGYQLQLPAGTYTVTFSGAGLSEPVVKGAAIGSDNVKVDLVSGEVGSSAQVPSGRAVGIAYDANGQLCMAWYDPQEQDMKLSVRSAAGDWSMTQTVDSSADVGAYLSLALDRQGRAGIAYYDATNGDLKYAHWNGNAWRVDTLDSYRSVGLYPSLAYDTAGNPVISYYDKTHGDLRIRSYDGRQWHVQTLASRGDVGRFSSLRINPATGRPAVAYEDTSARAIGFTQWTGSRWIFSTIDRVSGGFVSLAFDGRGRPAVSYYDAAQADLRFARYNDNAWDIQTVASRGAQGLYDQLTIDQRTGATGIVYYNRSADSICQAVQTRHGWRGQTLLSGGRWLSLAMRPGGGFSVAWSQNDELNVSDV